MATLTISDSTLKRLKAGAYARHMPLDAYLEAVAGQDAELSADSARHLAALESFAAGMTAWSTAHLPPGHQTDDSRETIYEGRGG